MKIANRVFVLIQFRSSKVFISPISAEEDGARVEEARELFTLSEQPAGKDLVLSENQKGGDKVGYGLFAVFLSSFFFFFFFVSLLQVTMCLTWSNHLQESRKKCL